jgi:hypothetical protein
MRAILPWAQGTAIWFSRGVFGAEHKISLVVPVFHGSSALISAIFDGRQTKQRYQREKEHGGC